MPLSKLFKSSSLLLALTITINHVNATCFQIPETFKSGECTMKLTWHKNTYYWNDDVSNLPAIRDFIQIQILDSLGKGISWDTTWQLCFGYRGWGCKFPSALPYDLVVSPQHRREYIQFYYGNIGWHTDPDPPEGWKYLGDDVKNQRPWCGVYTEWVTNPYDGPDGKTYKDDLKGEVKSIEVRNIYLPYP